LTVFLSSKKKAPVQHKLSARLSSRKSTRSAHVERSFKKQKKHIYLQFYLISIYFV